MSAEKISKYSGFARPLLFAFALLLHLAAFYFINFTAKEEEIDTVDFREAEVFKLVDVQEFVPPPPAPVEKKEVVTVSNQPKASENFVETKEEVVVEREEIVYLPQHKISSVPIIPSREVLSRIVYPPMALKQGIEAVVYLELFIDSNGSIKKIKVLKDPGHGFAQAAVKALEGVTCVPANANGKNCAVRYRYPVKFTLN
ncbi:energy transducer TonB [Treponema ruminis]|uniref:Protein TonB n=1 Tax=Treponema ruminis TaxID=744515 RepID=A0A7W8G8V0_9SPIR|nr:energy transducer TonB [Treponema ruminis]MBB5225956.1 protein TonB [Treponema ruminis]QSI03132.1 energy transducer TonB [Treponema ruminis]